jgi:hypothetical protein
MDQRERTDARRAFKCHESALLAILSEWDPIGGSPPAGEYDCLAHHLLSALHQNATVDVVRSILLRELREHFGISAAEPSIEDVAQRILTWWEGTSK